MVMSTTPSWSPTIYCSLADETLRRALVPRLAEFGCPVEEVGTSLAPSRIPAERIGCLLVDARRDEGVALDLYADLLRQDRWLSAVFLVDRPEPLATSHPLRTPAVPSGWMPPGRGWSGAVGVVETMEWNAIQFQILHALEAGRRWDWLLQNDLCLDARIRRLSATDQETLDMVLEGVPNKVMASRLFITLRGVELRRQRMLRRLDLRDAAELIDRTVQRRILSEVAVLRGTVGREQPPGVCSGT